ncbi:MAG: c-type cytochrome [Myxococcota bacterium]|jgi:cytochrome c
MKLTSQRINARPGTGSVSPAVAGLVGFAVLMVLGITACGGPEREIRKTLSEGEREVFDRGQRLSTPCWSCHDLYGKQNKVGPYLAGLYGRAAGSAQYPGYSKAIQESGVIWDEGTLRSFLVDPAGFIPGTTMAASGPRGGSDVRALVFYLKHVTSNTAAREN